MPVTRDDLDQFHRFATAKLNNGGAESRQALLSEFEAAQDFEKSVAGIRESVAECDASETVSVREAFDEVRQQLRWTK